MEVILGTFVSAKESLVKKSLIAQTTRLARSLGLGLAASLLASTMALAQSVDGEVKKIDVDAGKITLKHEGIKNLDQPAMQMAFRVANPAWLKTVQVGDKVKFSADKVGGQFTITAIEVKK
jgi:Cu(I)/Ag(I) efflux system protein CusF